MRKLRRKRLPPCKDIASFINSIENNRAIDEQFGELRGNAFYRGSVFSGGETASIFVVQDVLIRMQQGARIAFDGTFRICPLTFKQFFIVLTEVGGEFRL